jgi:hypothetical protein
MEHFLTQNSSFSNGFTSMVLSNLCLYYAGNVLSNPHPSASLVKQANRWSMLVGKLERFSFGPIPWKHGTGCPAPPCPPSWKCTLTGTCEACSEIPGGGIYGCNWINIESMPMSLANRLIFSLEGTVVPISLPPTIF